MQKNSCCNPYGISAYAAMNGKRNLLQAIILYYKQVSTGLIDFRKSAEQCTALTHLPHDFSAYAWLTNDKVS